MGIARSTLQCIQQTKCTASRTVSEQHSRLLGQYELVAHHAYENEHQGAELKRALSQRESLQNSNFM